MRDVKLNYKHKTQRQELAANSEQQLFYVNVSDGGEDPAQLPLSSK